jgi:hypothetical protein
MLAQLKRVSRRHIALVWAMIVVFAVAPLLSLAAAVPAGAFSRLLVHSHDGAELGHVYHGHLHHHGHEHDDGDHHHHADHGMGDVDEHDQSQPQPHVHYEAGCPSVVLPELDGAVVRHRLRDRVAIRRALPMQGAPPDRMLRPPIL